MTTWITRPERADDTFPGLALGPGLALDPGRPMPRGKIASARGCPG